MTSHDRQRRASADAAAARTRRPIQARLEVGPVDDPMEVEAEATADRVIAAIQTTASAQPVAARKALSEDELKGGGPAAGASDSAGGGPVAADNTGGGGPAQAADSGGGGPVADDEKAGAPAIAAGGGGPAAEDEVKRAPIASISRMGGPEEELPAQGYRIARVEDEELLQGSRISRAGAEEEELLQGSRIARVEDEELLQGSRIARSAVVGAEGGPVDDDLESRLTAGGGAPLPEPVRATMENAFGADFSAVRVSENPAAAEIGALAYTTGADVRFAPGQFKPGSTEGQHLLAHELTHVVQQGAAPAATAARAVAQRDGAGAKPTLADLMGPYHYQFRLFLRKNQGVEHIDFIDALDSQKGKKPEKPGDKPNPGGLISMFLADDAPMLINVSGGARAKVLSGEAEPESLRNEVMEVLGGMVQYFVQDPEAMATLQLT